MHIDKGDVPEVGNCNRTIINCGATVINCNCELLSHCPSNCNIGCALHPFRSLNEMGGPSATGKNI
jgi:hypothetical protein